MAVVPSLLDSKLGGVFGLGAFKPIRTDSKKRSNWCRFFLSWLGKNHIAKSKAKASGS